MNMHRLGFVSAVATLAWMPAGAIAHAGHGGGGGSATAGLLHPLTGLDHVLAMLAVGIWAAQAGGPAVWRLPAAFLGGMMLGGAAATANVPVPLVEAAIVASVLGLGALIITAARPGLGVSVAIVSAFALFHGYAHVAELPSGASPAAYGAGFLASTALLHATGIAIAVMLRNAWTASFVRASGVLVVVGGLLPFIG